MRISDWSSDVCSSDLAWLDNLETAFPGLRVCRDSGRDAAGVLDGLLDGKVKSLLSLGGNFGVAAPDSPRVLAALERCQRSEEHTSELQSLMRISYAVFCLKKKTQTQHQSHA